MKSKMLVLCLATLTSGSYARQKVIYGIDNRTEPIDYPNPQIYQLSRSAAAMIVKSNIMVKKGEAVISADRLEDRGVCSDEAFANQPTAANCSGFLVGKDLLVTAGHCIQSNNDCIQSNWVFDYTIENLDHKTGAVIVPENSVYECKSIVSRALDSQTKNDYALIRLKRQVTDRAPLAYRKKGLPTVNQSMIVMGFPTGIPLKITDQAIVRSLQKAYFVINADTFGGNSGSAVIDEKTGMVEGILVRGERDYRYNSNKGCDEAYVLPSDQGRGEDVTFIGNIPELK